jgi:hypothetical protein
MRTVIPTLAAAALALAACAPGGALSGLNPFSRSTEVGLEGPAAPPGGALRVADDRGLVQDVTALVARPLPGGVVLEARGLPPVQGFWDADLVRVGRGPQDGVLTLDFRVEPPLEPRPPGTAASREVVTAAYVSDAALRGVRTIRVRGLTSAREVRR